MLNKPKFLKIVILALFLLLVVGGISGWIYHSRTQKQLQNENQYQQLRSRQRELEYDKRLQASELERKSVQRHLDSLAFAFDHLDRIHAADSAELVKIKGRFSKLTGTELSKKMIEEYNKSLQHD